MFKNGGITEIFIIFYGISVAQWKSTGDVFFVS